MSSSRRVYLDYAGAGLPLPSQLAAVAAELPSLRLGNPHSRHPSGLLSGSLMDAARRQILAHFHASPEDYSVVFTAGATASLKLIAEAFRFGAERSEGQAEVGAGSEEPLAGPSFVYARDSHTSVLGMREVVAQRFGTAVRLVCLPSEELERRLEPSQDQEASSTQKPTEQDFDSLLVYPAQSNFSGRKYPLEWISAARDGALGPGRWWVCLDAATFAATSPLDLSLYTPDFVPVSFYKLFGYPSGLGCLLVRREAEALLRDRAYFGGGTVSVALAGQRFHRPRPGLSSALEDGTGDYYGVAALRHGFEALKSLGGMGEVQRRSFGLTRLAYETLAAFRHDNGAPLLKFYLHDRDSFTVENQGSILNFNVLDESGDVVGYSQVSKMAEVYGIELRTGCFCNLGACQDFLRLTDADLIRLFREGKVCGDSMDVVEGRATGSVRVSFGWASAVGDVEALCALLFDAFLPRPSRTWHEHRRRLRWTAEELGLCEDPLPPPDLPRSSSAISSPSHEHKSSSDQVAADIIEDTSPSTSLSWDACEPSSSVRVSALFVYPVKSMRGVAVSEWEVGPGGLRLDRAWMVVDSHGLALSQKRCPALATVQPSLQGDRLVLRAGREEVSVGTEVGEGSESLVAKVCSERVRATDCGEEAAEWLGRVLGLPGARLLRQLPAEVGGERTSLANEADFLLLSTASLRHLMHPLRDLMALDDVLGRFRGNVVVSGGAALAEEGWRGLEVGEAAFRVTGRCSRCQMVCVDQRTGHKDPAVLAALRNAKGEMTFGVYLALESGSGGRVKVTDAVRPIE